MEIAPLRLTKVQYNPMEGETVSVADNIRKSAEAKFTRQMRDYNQKKMEREENDYKLGKRTENFVFSNYPSSKVQGEFGEALQNLRFGPGSKSKWREKWKNSVGGNMQGFEAWYGTSKASELKGIQRTLVRDPSQFLTDESWTNHINDIVRNMDPSQRRMMIGHFQDDPTTMNIFNSVYQPSKDRTVDTVLQHFKDDPLIYGSLGTAATIFGGFMLARKGKYKEIGQYIKDKAGIISKDADLDIPTDFRRSFISAKDYTEDQMQKMLDRGLINKAQHQALKNGDSVVPQAFFRGKTKVGGQLGLFDEAVGNGAKSVRFMQTDVNRYVKDGILNQSQGDQLMGIINDMSRKGELISPRTLMERMSGKKFEGLREVLSAKKDMIPGFGALKNPGFFKGIGLAGGLYYGSSKLAEGMGFGEGGQEIAGVTSSLLAPSLPSMTSKIKEVVDNKGIAYLVKKLSEAGSWKLAARVASKGLLGGPVGWGLAAFDIYTIGSILLRDSE
tara:strand:+ start:10024 stop:11526 length:1503 start_codon:yes stop_codon:yes gene_type:complete